MKLQFPSEEENRTVLFKFLDIFHDYNKVDIKKIIDYIEAS